MGEGVTRVVATNRKGTRMPRGVGFARAFCWIFFSTAMVRFRCRFTNSPRAGVGAKRERAGFAVLR
jgi:hypothetical protein